jgi:hypothetical protein
MHYRPERYTVYILYAAGTKYFVALHAALIRI